MDRLLECSQLGLLEFRRYRHPSHSRLRCRRYRDRMGQFRSIRQNAR